MRKSLFFLLMAATAATPIAAQAQESNSRMERAQQRYQRLEQRNQQRNGGNAAAQQAAQQQAAQRAEARAQRQGQRQVVRQNRYQRGVATPATQAQRDAWRQRQYQDRYRQNTQGVNPALLVPQDGNDKRRRVDRSRYRQLERQNQARYSGNWNRGWRNDRRYNWRSYRSSNRYLYSRPYYAPYRGYSYSRLGIGYTLGSAFFGSNYWISDPWQYRLPPAYPGTRWVRYYDDVLLVDVYTGEVVDVIHDFFW